MRPKPNRRQFLQSTTALAAGGFFAGCEKQPTEEELAAAAAAAAEAARFKISLAQWSMHRALKSGELDNLDFPRVTKEICGINAVEWVNQFFSEEHPTLGFQPKDQTYLSEMKKRTDDFGVKNVLIMCDRVGSLGDPDESKRSDAVTGHFAWVEAAKFLGCHAIRVNAASDKSLSPEVQRDLCVDGLSRLCAFAEPLEMNVIVENHGGLSSNGAWLASVMTGVKAENCGTLPDFGNFYVAKNRGKPEQYAKEKAIYEGDDIYQENEGGLEYDRYQGVSDLMPYAKGVSAKSHDFNDQGEETHTDFLRMMKIVADSDYEGYVGVEYEGKETAEIQGIKLTRALLEKTFAAVS